MQNSNFITAGEAVALIQRGEMLVLNDDESRENEADVVFAAEFVSPEKINFLIKHCRGLVCVPASAEILDRLNIPLMVKDNKDPHRTQFTVSIDHRECGTGISAYDRYISIRSMADENSSADDFRKPGHVFPLRESEVGVAGRQGHTEASLWLCRQAGLTPVSVICEIINEDGNMAREDSVKRFCLEHRLKRSTIQSIVESLEK